MLSNDELVKRFGQHKGTIEGPNPLQRKHHQFRMDFSEFAAMLDDQLPDGRNKALALTALEEASMWSHKAIANDS